MVDWSKIKKEYIAANDVPTGRGSQSPWDEIFAEIPSGQALVLHEPQVNSGTVGQALRSRQRKGKFKNLKISTKGRHGTATIYITNTEKPTSSVTFTRRSRSGLSVEEEKAMRP